MKSTEQHIGDTQGRILQSACEVFAQKGYRDATIAEICENAGANIAAVNYHFGSKENLYAEAWRHSFQQSLQAHPADGGVGADAPAEERFRARIGAFLRRGLDTRFAVFDIMHMEMANPTGLLDEVWREMIAPLRRSMAGVIRELLGEGATEQQVRLCGLSTIGQCIHSMARRRLKRLPSDGGFLETLPCEALAEHIASFSLAGIREMRGQGHEPPPAADGGDPEGGDG